MPTDRSRTDDITGRDPLDLLLERLGQSSLAQEEREIVLSAAVDDQSLRDYIGGVASREPEASKTLGAFPPATFLKGISVTGLRGIGERADIELDPGPGLTLVVGRNGSGKSSFAEAVELALTGTSSRWAGRRSKEWADGWWNRHYSGEREVQLQLCVEGTPGSVTVRRSWPTGAGLEEGHDFAQRQGQPRQHVAELGFAGPLKTWRPFLSYNELGGLLEEGPSALYDAISRVLGFDLWSEIESRATAARKDLDEEIKAARNEAERLREILKGLDDDRATAVLKAVPARNAWDLAVVESQVIAGRDGPPSSVQALQALSALPDLDEGALTTAIGALEQALADVAETVGTDAARARQLASLLQQALDVHGHQEDARCPVCGTADVLTEQWREGALRQIEDLREKSTSAEAASSALTTATRSARNLITPVPAVVKAGETGVETSALMELWAKWAQLPEQPEDLLQHLRTWGELRTQVAAVRQAAGEELKRRQDLWGPVANQVVAWLPGARKAQANIEWSARLKNVTDWLGDEINWLRNERFAPIAKHVQVIWERLRQTSSVSLDNVELAGTKTRRHVKLSVSVDDTAGAALAVMSQGELHALALSLFLPRATLPESPFRFIVIDDPVQAMDGARVDGLAMALADVAATHQVIVLTQDERLPEAVRRLGVSARVLEVSRQDHSRVSVRVRKHPVDNYIQDAFAVLSTPGYPPEAAETVVAGLCRNAVEAACLDVIRRRQLSAGRSHLDVAELLMQTTKLKPRIGLALWDDQDKGGRVIADVSRRWGPRLGDCVSALDGGAHETLGFDLKDLARASESLAQKILGMS